GLWSAIGGGSENAANTVASAVAGGISNTAGVGGLSGQAAFVGGGFGNTAAGNYSTISGGQENCAGGDHSWAGGRSARVRPGDENGDGTCTANSGDSNGDEGTFLWGGASSGAFLSSGPSQFGVRASGIFFGTPSASIVSMPFGRFINTSSGAYLSTGGTWTNASSRSLKTGFESVDPLTVLSKLADLPLSTWLYKNSVEGRHLGPTAEDFKAAFELGGDGTSIATVDADGVALAAIQGLNQKLEKENAELRADLDQKTAALEAQSAAFEIRLHALEAAR
ncbi:MAG: tail fiber domain-containing protein, partial [Dokdonella sp.]